MIVYPYKKHYQINLDCYEIESHSLKAAIAWEKGMAVYW
jgi:hypothetical protein